ncbi:MAG: nucleotidyltransferase domain-containing protein [Myxococcales bacterium]|nr:nucleotidyltransferase domain-containing protein [Myxococcales bacterium]
MAYPLPSELTPTTFEGLIARLPARARADFEWFPMEFRTRFIAPLARASAAELPALVDELSVPALGLFVRLGQATSTWFADPVVAEALAPNLMTSRSSLWAILHSRLLELPSVEGDLVEADAWMRAILSALVRDFRTELALGHASVGPPPTDDELRAALSGELGFFVRGVLLTTAAIEIASGAGPLPATLGQWSRMACSEMQAAANALRALGLSVPTAVRPMRSRAPQPFVRATALPSGVLDFLEERLRAEEVWLFGSRGRGTHAPNSDWDVLVVVPDGTTLDDEDWPLLRRAQVEIFPVTRSEFEQERFSIGTLSHAATTQGYRVDER